MLHLLIIQVKVSSVNKAELGNVSYLKLSFTFWLTK